jgi:hypothetical protein
MGKETWIISPVLPYYLWADGKDSSIWYRNVRLFRQEKFGEWEDVLNRVVEQFNATEIRRVK